MDKSRLYYQIPCVKSFICTMERCEESGKGIWLVTLNQTGPCLERGEQSYGTGVLSGTPVVSVHKKGEQVIHELVQPIEEGTLTERVIDRQRRYDNMQLHTRGYILSGLVHKYSGHGSMGFHMGVEEVTVDFNSIIESENLDWLEDEANQLVYANASAGMLYPSEDKLKTMECRSKKESSGLMRTAEVFGADVCARCSTHVENIGKVGIIKMRSMIHYKGGARLSMLCRRKALLDYRDRLKDGARISSLLSAKLVQVPDAVEKLKSDSQDKDYLTRKLGSSLLALEMGQFPESIEPLIVFEEDLTSIQVRQYMTFLYEQNKARVVAVCSGSGRGSEHRYALGSSQVDTRVLSKAMNSRLSGRGGSSGLMAQGTSRAAREVTEAASLEEIEL